MLELPFTQDQFLNVFRDYNNAIWPVQVFTYLAGILTIFLTNQNRPFTNKIISLALGVFWLWMGVCYHILFFSDINTAAYFFGGLFLIQGLLFLITGFITTTLEFHFRSNWYGALGGLFIFYALIIYPIWGTSIGHEYPFAPIFGVAPCPTAIFTFGLLLWSTPKLPLWLLIIPGLWALIGFVMAIQLAMPEDFVLLAAGATSIGMLVYRPKNS